MKLKVKCEIIDIGGQKTLVPVDCGDYKLVLQMNETSEDIINLLKEDTTEDRVVCEMLKIYNASEEDIRKSVKKVIEHLRADNLLTD